MKRKKKVPKRTPMPYHEWLRAFKLTAFISTPIIIGGLIGEWGAGWIITGFLTLAALAAAGAGEDGYD